MNCYSCTHVSGCQDITKHISLCLRFKPLCCEQPMEIAHVSLKKKRRGWRCAICQHGYDLPLPIRLIEVLGQIRHMKPK